MSKTVETVLSIYLVISGITLWAMPNWRDMTPKFRWIGIPLVFILSVFWPIYIIIVVIDLEKFRKKHASKNRGMNEKKYSKRR